jgi:hypothetical protein
VLALALVLVGQALGVTTWLALNKVESRVVQERPRLAIGLLLSFGMAGAIPWTSMGRAVTEAEPELVPRYRRRILVSLAVTIAGVLVAFAAFMAN